MEELSKFIGQVPGDRPVTFARYTGQEDRDERKRVADEPPDILLTNFMMLELLMTRQEETDRRVIGNCEGLGFLVLDELHTLPRPPGCGRGAARAPAFASASGPRASCASARRPRW